MCAGARFQLTAQPSITGRYEPVEFAVAVAAPDAASPFADLRCTTTFGAEIPHRSSVPPKC